MPDSAAAYTPQGYTRRPLRDDEDFWRVRRLLVETFPITGLGWNIDVRNWDASRFYDPNPDLDPEWAARIRLWETAEGRLAGAAMPEDGGWFYLQLHPDYREDLEAGMIAWAEENLAVPVGDGQGRRIQTMVYDYDFPRQRLLGARGYEMLPHGSVARRMYLGDRPLPPVPAMAPGYTLRTLRGSDPADCQRLADLLNAAFGRTFHTAGEMLTFSRLAPSYDEDLHLVAKAPDGSFAAHAAIILEPVNRSAVYEPVCTHPDHRRKGLARILMLECLHRVKARGARQVFVETGQGEAANRLYDSFLFTEKYTGHVWCRVWGR